MKHLDVRWNPATLQWFCTECGRTSDQANVRAAHEKLDQYECQIPSVETPRAEPGTETVRLMRKPYKMTPKSERSGSRFVVRTIDEGKPVIQLELFHDTLSLLASVTVGFELLSGLTLDQAKILVEAMNERIVGVIVTPRV
jgi:hypothetical protein